MSDSMTSEVSLLLRFPAPPATTALLLASGGLDSTVLAYWLTRYGVPYRVACINYAQHTYAAERAALGRVLPAGVQIYDIDVSDVLCHSPSRLVRPADLWHDDIDADALLIPYRNLFLLSTGVTLAASLGCETLFTAFINSNHAREIDASEAYLNGLLATFAAVGAVNVQMPFRNAPKADVARLGVELGAPIAETYSCQAHPLQHCGACPNCVDRLSALAAVSTVTRRTGQSDRPGRVTIAGDA